MISDDPEMFVLLCFMIIYSIGCIGYMWNIFIKLFKVKKKARKRMILILLIVVPILARVISYYIDYLSFSSDGRIPHNIVSALLGIPFWIIWVFPVLHVGYKGFRDAIQSMKKDEE